MLRLALLSLVLSTAFSIPNLNVEIKKGSPRKGIENVVKLNKKEELELKTLKRQPKEERQNNPNLFNRRDESKIPLHRRRGELIYLATFPRSGTEWTRSMLERATKVATGVVYAEGFPPVATPRCYCSTKNLRCPDLNENVVIKTHYPAINCNSPYDGKPHDLAIRLVRHPLDSFYSYYVLSQNVAQAKVEQRMPRQVLARYIDQWRQFHLYWNHQQNVFTVRYEDLHHNQAEVLRLILDASRIPYTQEDFEQALLKFPPTGGILKHLQHYSREDLALVEKELGKLMLELGYKITEVEGL